MSKDTKKTFSVWGGTLILVLLAIAIALFGLCFGQGIITHATLAGLVFASFYLVEYIKS